MFFDKLHSFAKTWVFKVILALICSSFVVLGLTDAIMQFIRNKPLAKVGSLSVGVDEYARAINMETARIAALSKEKVDRSVLKQLGLHQKILDQLVGNRAFKQFISDLNLRASSDMVKKEIQAVPGFQKDGEYDSERLRALLRERRISELSFTDDIRSGICQYQLVQPLSMGMSVPKIYTHIIMDELSEKSVFHTATLSLSHVKLKEPITDEGVRLYYNHHKEDYRVPEYRSVQYVVFDEDKDSHDIAVTEAEIQDRYEQMASEFSSPEFRFVEKITCPSFALANEAIALLDKNMKPKDVAKKLKRTTYDDMGVIEPGILSKNTEEAIFSLSQGHHSEPVSNGHEFSVYYVTKIEPSKKKSLAEVKDQVKHALQKEKYAENFQALRNGFEDALASGQSLAEAAKTHNATLVNAGPFNHAGENEKETLVLDKLKEDVRSAILAQTFEQVDGSECHVVDVSSGIAVAVRLGTVTPSFIPELKDIQEKVAHDFEKSEKKKQIEALVSKMMKNVKSSKDFDAAIHAAHFGSVEKHRLSRLDMDTRQLAPNKDTAFFMDLAQDALTRLFKTSIGGIILSVNDKDMVTILYHDHVEKGDMDGKIKKSIADNINRYAKEDTMPTLISIAKDRMEIKINHELLEQMNRAMNDGD